MNTAPYSGSLTAEQFLFYEIRIASKLYAQGISVDEAISRIKADNLFQYPTEREVARMTRACYRRLDALNNQYLIQEISSAPTEIAKQINLYAIMRYNRLVWDFMIQVIGEKFRTQDFSFERKDRNTFFSHLQAQNDSVAGWSDSTISKIKSVLVRCLVETEYLEHFKSTTLNSVLLCEELEQAIHEKLETFNHKPFQKREGSRAACFAEEKLFLLPLPAMPFELAVWKVATVQYNYHISVERMNYSVPYEYIKQQVDVRLTRTTVEIFFAGTRIASHLRLHGRPNQYSTAEDHMPPDHQAYLQWNGERFIRWAEQIGQHTAAVVRLFLSAHKVEQQGYKSCMALLKLADRYSAQRLESACRKALSYTVSPSLKSVQSILKSGQDKLLAEDAPAKPEEPKAHKFTRGAGYYKRGE